MDFDALVRHHWQSFPTVGGMWGFFDKRCRLRTHLKQWNMEVFGNILDAVAQAEEAVIYTERVYDSDPTETTRERYYHSVAQIRLVQNRAFLFWKQKVNVKCLKERDANTTFYHQTVKDKRRRQSI